MKYVPGLMVGQLSGKAGSTVASRNKGGSYFRTRVIPKHVVNAKTTAVRENFGNTAQAYRDLTDSMRSAWDSLGAQITRKTSLGETIHLTGLQAMMMINRNLSSMFLPPDYIAPVFSSPPTLEDVTLTATSGAASSTTVIAGANSATQNVTSTADMFVGQTLNFETAAVFRIVASITDGTHVVLTEPVASTTAEVVSYTEAGVVTFAYDPTPLPTGIYMLIECTAPLSAGVSRPSRGQFRAVSVFAAGAASPNVAFGNYFPVFGAPISGSKIFWRARFLTPTGFSGAALAGFSIVA